MSKPKATAAEVKAMREKNPGMGMHDAKQAVEASGLQVNPCMTLWVSVHDEPNYGEGIDFSEAWLHPGNEENPFVDGELYVKASAIAPLVEALKKIAQYPCDHKYSAECKGCYYDRLCHEALATLPPELKGEG